MAVSKPRPEGRGHQDCARDGRVGNTVELTDSMAQLESGLESPQAQKSQVEVKRDEANEGPVENADAGYITGARLHVISIRYSSHQLMLLVDVSRLLLFNGLWQRLSFVNIHEASI